MQSVLLLGALLLALAVACGPAAPTAVSIPPWDPPTPTPPADTTATLVRDIPHPEGLKGCRSFNPWSAHDDYFQWCWEALQDDIREHCSGIGTATQEWDCADNRLEDVQNYMMRVLFSPCEAISDTQVQRGCNEESLEAYSDHHSALISSWNAVLRAVTDNAEVRASFQLVGECVEGLGYGFEAPDASVPLPWQEMDPNVETAKLPLPWVDPEAREAEIQRRSAINHCAVAVGLYEVQDAKWRSEIKRLPDAERKPLEDEGFIDIFEEPGPAPLLGGLER